MQHRAAIDLWPHARGSAAPSGSTPKLFRSIGLVPFENSVQNGRVFLDGGAANRVLDHFGRVRQRLDLFVPVEVAEHCDEAVELDSDGAADRGFDGGVDISSGLFRGRGQEVDKLLDYFDFAGIFDAGRHDLFAKFLILSIIQT